MRSRPNWLKRPIFIAHWPSDDPEIEYAIFIDENGDSSLKHVLAVRDGKRSLDSQNAHFSLTACCFHRDEFMEIRRRITELKEKYWPGGLFDYNGKIKRVCFHSNEIRHEKGPFSSKVIDRNAFLSDLTEFIKTTETRIFTAYIDKMKHVNRYKYPQNPYDLCVVFLFERIVMSLKNAKKKSIIIFETRGYKEDRTVLKEVESIITHGTSKMCFQDFDLIAGVYFNPKWCAEDDGKRSYFCLELTDLMAYPIYRMLAYNVEGRDFDTIKHKIYGYPNRMEGRGMKKFP